MTPRCRRRVPWRVLPLLLAAGSPACNDVSEIRSGEYRVTSVWDESCGAEAGCAAARIEGARLTVDAGRREAVLDFRDGEVLSLTWSARAESKWPEGCPTNTGHTRMEVGVVDEAPLEVDWLEFEKPVFVAGCPAGSRSLSLTEDVDLGGGAGCNTAGKACITFERD